MREHHPFSQSILLAGFIMLLLSLLLPWWGSYGVLKQQAQQVHTQLTLSAAPTLDNSTPFISTVSTTPLPHETHAWWYGQLAGNQHYSQGDTELYYRLITRPATVLWLSISVPLMLVTLILFGALYRRFARGYHAESGHLRRIILDPNAATTSHSHPLAGLVLDLHHDFKHQLDTVKQQLHIAQQQSFQDNLTLLGNRFAFSRDLALLLNGENQLASHTLMIVRAASLQDINIGHGFQAGDQYLLDIVKIIRKTTQSELTAQIYRLSGTDIAVLFNGQCEPLAQRLGERLKQELSHYQHIHELACAAYIGFTQVLAGQKAEHVLTRADLALAQAQSDEPNSWALVLRQADEDSLGETQWRQRLQAMLDDNQVLLQVQPVHIYKPQMPGYNEIYTRFPNASGGTYPASTVFAMLQRLNMSMLFEQKIIERILHQIGQSTLSEQRWAINLTPTSLQLNSFLIWLERTLLKDPAITSKLVFELDEQVLQHQLVTAKRLLDVIRSCGARYAVSRFGRGYGSFRLLKEIKPDYVKLEGALVRQLAQDHTSQQFTRMIVDLAQRLGCAVIAEGVETAEQKILLESMHIDGIQGYLIAKPMDFADFKAL
ncbi:GGDEF-domain containing protein [Oceanisphaera avium]|uniref:GGDEF-domain containing protein n=2 Tax=Oceanisphaera avium TaxID=1903694 RepID=A0A1Y0D0E5_9GAMM|nr:GGDEF-domain containing protein [Oceanisphaera avium]